MKLTENSVVVCELHLCDSGQGLEGHYVNVI